MERVKLLSMTVMLTLLIWASADSLVSKTITLSVSFDVEPASPGSNMLIDVDQPIEVQISGPRKAIEDIQAQEPHAVRLPIPDYPTGRTAIQLDKQTLERHMAEQWRAFRKASIVSLNPPALPVTVDHTVTEEADITLNRLTLQYDDEPQLSRARAVVLMRESVFQQLAVSGQLAPFDISRDVERHLKEKPPGRSATVSVALDASGFGRDAQITPPTIEVTATVSAERSTAEIPTVPILLAVSFANLEKPFAAVPRDGNVPVTRTVKVTGPSAEVQRLLRGEIRAFGLIQLKEDDLHAWDDFRPMRPEYHLPPGVKLVEEPKPIEFKLIDETQTVTKG